MRPVVIVDPLSSGVALAPAFRARGIPAVAVTLDNQEWPEFGAQMARGDFLAIIPNQKDIVRLVKDFNPIAILPGTEEGIELAESLTLELLPHLANAPHLSRHRSHKALMQEALRNAGLPYLKSFSSNSLETAKAWLRTSGLEEAPLIVKPPSSSGSEMVHHINAGGDWRPAFQKILSEPYVLTGLVSEAAVLQEQALGQEYALGTVSCSGQHHLIHIIKYTKLKVGGRRTVYDHVEFVPFEGEAMSEIFSFTEEALDALGVRWGATHTEVMMTAHGPRLIETSARMIGGPVVHFARTATGSSQADRLVEAYIDQKIEKKFFEFQKTVVPVFLRATRAGVIQNLDSLDQAQKLASFHSKYVWFKNGDHVPETVDYLTSLGIIALSGDRDQIFSDIQRVRAFESQLAFL